MMEYYNYTLFIGHLIPAMTDAAPKTLNASICTFMWQNRQRSHKSPTFQRWADKYLLPDGESLLIKSGDLFLQNMAAGTCLSPL